MRYVQVGDLRLSVIGLGRGNSDRASGGTDPPTPRMLPPPSCAGRSSSGSLSSTPPRPTASAARNASSAGRSPAIATSSSSPRSSCRRCPCRPWSSGRCGAACDAWRGRHRPLPGPLPQSARLCPLDGGAPAAPPRPGPGAPCRRQQLLARGAGARANTPSDTHPHQPGPLQPGRAAGPLGARPIRARGGARRHRLQPAGPGSPRWRPPPNGPAPADCAGAAHCSGHAPLVGPQPLLAALRDVAAAHAATPAQVALGLAHRAGERGRHPRASSVAQLEENVAAAELGLTAGEVERLTAEAGRFESAVPG